MSVSDIPAAGGTVSSGTVTYTQTRVQNYTSGGTKGLSNVTSGGSISYSTAVSASSKGTTISSRTKVGTLTATVTLNGKTSSKSADIYQVENQVESIKIGGNSGDSTIFSTPKVDVACGENEWWQYSCWATYSSNATKSILASDFTLTSNQSWATVSTGNANWLKRVDFASRGTTPGEVRSVTLTANYSGKSATVSVAQEANSATYGGVTINGGSVSVIPASGGSVSSMSGISASQTVTFTSSSSRAGSVKITYSNAVTASSKGTSISNQTTVGTLTATATGEGSKTATKALTVYQAGNYVTAIKGSLGTFSYPTISAGATSATPNLSAGFGVLFTFSSGSTSSSTPASTYGSLSVTSSFKWSASQNGFIAVNSSTGVLTATNRGTTVGAARTSGTVTRTLTATWTPTSSYNAAGTKTNSWSTTATCTQELNKVTALNITSSTGTSYPSGDIPASGGTKTPVLGAKLSYTYSSGSVQSTGLTGYSASRTYSMPTTSGFSLNSSTGVVTGADRTTVVGSRRSATITCKATISYTNPSTVGGGTVSDSITDTLTVYQQANDVSYSDISVPNFSYPSGDIPYQGGSKSPTLSYSQTASYTSGHTKTITTGASLTYAVTGTGFSINSSTGVVTASANTGARRTATVSVTIHLNNKIRSQTIRVYQAAWVKPTITFTISYNGSTGSVNASQAVKDGLEIMISIHDGRGNGYDTTYIMQEGQIGISFSGSFPIAELYQVNTSFSPYETSNAKYIW